MAWLLIEDYVRRRWWIYVIAAAQVLLMAMGLTAEHASVFPVVPVLMGAAAVLGPLFAGGYLPARELRLLPLTRHQRWLAYWGLSMVAAGVVSAAAAVSILLPVLFGRALWPAVEMVAMVSLWTCTFVGTTVSLVSFASLTPATARGLPRLVTTTTRIVCLSLAMGGIGLAIVWRDHLATEWHGMTRAATVALSGMLLLTVLGALRSPGPFGGLEAVVGGPSGPVGLPSWLRLRDRITGLPKLVWRDWVSALARCGAAVLLLEGVLALVDVAMPAERATGLVAEGWFGAEFRPEFQFFYLAYVLVSVTDGHGFFRLNLVRGSIRHLRSLPITPWTIAVLLLSRRLAGWVALWLALLLAHLVFVGPPEALRFEWLLCIAGVDALVDAGRLRYRFGFGELLVGFFMIGVPLAALAKGLIIGTPLATPFALLVGVVGLTVALISHYHAVTGEGDVYRPEPPSQWLRDTAVPR